MIVVLPPSCHDHPFRKDEGTRQNVHVFFRVETALALKLGKWKTPSNSTIDDVPIRKNGTFPWTFHCNLYWPKVFYRWHKWIKTCLKIHIWRVEHPLTVCLCWGPRLLTHFHKYPWVLICLGLTWKGKMRSLPLRLERLSAPRNAVHLAAALEYSKWKFGSWTGESLGSMLLDTAGVTTENMLSI